MVDTTAIGRPVGFEARAEDLMFLDLLLQRLYGLFLNYNKTGHCAAYNLNTFHYCKGIFLETVLYFLAYCEHRSNAEGISANSWITFSINKL